MSGRSLLFCLLIFLQLLPDARAQCQAWQFFESCCCYNCYNYIPNCYGCTNYPLLCNSCYGNYFLYNNTCILCSQSIQDCQTCSSNISCLTCVNTGLVPNFNCTPCYLHLPYCMNCSYPTECLQCINQSYAIFNSSCELCGYGMEGCTTCQDSTICLTCSPPFLALNKTSLCQNCSVFMIYCEECRSNTTCTKCTNYGYLDSFNRLNCVVCNTSMKACIKCLDSATCISCYSGRVVEGGCSTVPGCTAVTRLLANYTHSCRKCQSPQFWLNLTSNLCECTKGHLAGQLCTQIAGCTLVTKNITGEYCQQCNNMEKFTKNGSTCSCISGYQFANQTQNCPQICGDGILFNLKCDDGNNLDGDGCSSTCEVEQSYVCKDGSKTTPSRCIYENRVTISLTSIQKIHDANQVLISLQCHPPLTSFDKINLTSWINFTLNKNFTIKQIKSINGAIQILLQYQEDIEGQLAKIKIKFDPTHIRSPDFQMSFTLQGQGQLLKYSSMTRSQTSKSLILALAIYSLVIFLLGSISFRMIGVQTLHVFQIIFLMHSFAVNYGPSMTQFKTLQYSFGMSRFMVAGDTLVYSKYLYYLNMSSIFTSNCLLIGIIQTLLILTDLFLNTFYKCKVQQQSSNYGEESNIEQIKKPCQNKNKFAFLQRLKFFKDFVYNSFVFPFTIGFIFLLQLSVSTATIFSNNRQPSTSDKLVSLEMVFLTLSIGVVFMWEWKFLFITQKKKEIDQQIRYPKYLPVYLSYILLLSFFILFSLFSTFSYTLVLSGVIIASYTLFICVRPPYKAKIHNLSIIFNQLTLLGFVLRLIIQCYIETSESQELILSYAVIGCLTVVLLLSTIRTVFEIKGRISKLMAGDIEKNLENRARNPQMKKKVNDYSIYGKGRLFQHKTTENWPTKDQFGKNDLYAPKQLIYPILTTIMPVNEQLDKPNYLNSLFLARKRRLRDEKQSGEIKKILKESFQQRKKQFF